MFWKKIICYVLILNHVWISSLQATNSVISDVETQAEEKAWRHLAKRRVLIDPETTLSGEKALRLRTFSTEFLKELKDQQIEDEDKETLLEQNPVESLNLLLTPSSVKDLFPELPVSPKGIYCTVEGLDLFISWKGKVWVRGGETDSVSLETKRSLIFTHPVKARGLTIKAEYCEILSALDIEEDLDVDLYGVHKGLVIGHPYKGHKGILSAQNMTLHEGDLHIEAGGALLLKEQGVLDLKGNSFLNESLLEALGDASIHHVGLLHNKFNMIAPQGTLKLGGRELRNEGAKIEGRNLSLNFDHLTNTPVEGNEGWNNPAIIMATENLSLEGEGSAMNGGTLQGNIVTLKNKTFTNKHLLKAENQLHVSAKEQFLNEQDGWVKIEGQGTVSGSGKVINLGGRINLEDPLAEEHQPLEGAGMTFQSLLFDHFTGTLMNEGSWMTKEKVTGDVKTFVNRGTWKSDHTALTIQQFETLLGKTLQDSKIVGDGQWTIKTGVNRSLMQGEDLEIIVQGDFDQKGVLQANQRLEFQGENIQNEGRIETQKLVWQGRQLINLPAGNIHVKGKSDLDLGKLDNEGILDFKGAVTAQIQKTKNRGGSTLSFASDSLYTGKTFKKYGTLKGEGFLKLIMEEQADLHQNTEMDGDLSLTGRPLNTSPESKTISKRKLSMEASDGKGTLQPLILKGTTEGKEQFKIKASKLKNTGDMLSPQETFLHTPEGFTNEKKAHLRHLSMNLDARSELLNTGEMVLSSPVKLAQDSHLVNKGKMQIGKLNSLHKKSSILTHDPLLNKADFDRDYIETTLLPHIRDKITKNPSYIQYRDYDSFVPEKSGAGYKTGMDLNKYWQSWLSDPYWGEKAKNNPLPIPYLFKGYPSFSSHFFQNITNEGDLLLAGDQYQVKGTLFNKKDATLIYQGGAELLYKDLANEGTIRAPHGIELFSLNPKHPLLLKGIWDIRGNLTLKFPELEVMGKIYALAGSTLTGNRMTLHPGSLWQSTGTGHHFWHLLQSFQNDGKVLLEGSLGIRSPKIDLLGEIQALKGSSILGQEMTIHPKGIFKDGGEKTIWNIQNIFRNDGKMEMNHWHLMAGKQGYHSGSLVLGGNGRLEGINFDHKGNTWAKGNIHVLMSKKFDQGGEMSADSNIQLDAPILLATPHSVTKAGNELSLKTSYPLNGSWEGTKHFSWEGKVGDYINMISSGTIISPTKTTFRIPAHFENRGKAELNRLSMDLSYGHQLINTGEMLLTNPVKLGHDAQLVNKKKMTIGNLDPLLKKPSVLTYNPLMNKEDFDEDYIKTILLPTLQEFCKYDAYKTYEAFVRNAPTTGYKPDMDFPLYWKSWLNHPYWGKGAKANPLPPYLFKGYPSFSGHLFQHITNEGELVLSGEQYKVRGTLFNKKGAKLFHQGGVELLHNVIANEGTFYAFHGMQMISQEKNGNLSLSGRWESPEMMILKTPKVLTNEPSGILVSPKATSIEAGQGWINKGQANLSGLYLYIAPGNNLTNTKTGIMELHNPVSLGYDFNILNQGLFKAGMLSPLPKNSSYLVFDPKEDVYGKGYKEWIEGNTPWHMLRRMTNEGELLLTDSGRPWKLSDTVVNASAKIFQIGGGLRLRSKAVPKNQGILRFLTDGEVEAHLSLVFTGEWQGNQHLIFSAPSLNNSVGKVRSKGILSLTSTQGDILVGQAQKIMRPVRELISKDYQYVSSYWEQNGNDLWINTAKPRSYPYTLTGGGSLTSGECSYPHLTHNEALFQSGTGIKISAKGKLLNHFGLMHSQGFMTLKADKEIDNYSGIIQAQGDILFQTPYLQNRLSDVMVDRLSDYDVYFRGDQSGHIRWQHPASDPALMASTGGNLRFKINSGRNHGSRILGAKSVLFEQGSKTSSTHSSFQATSGFMSKNVVNNRDGSQTYTAWDGYYPSLIQGGNTIQVVMPGVSWSQEGMMNAPMIQLHLNNFDLNAHMERIGIQKHSVPDTKVRPFKETLIINLGEMFPQSVVKALKDGEKFSNISSSIIPKDQIVQVRQPGSLSPKNDLPFYLSSEALQGSLMQALSSIAGTLNITKEFDLEAQMRALHRQAKERSGQGQEIVLKDQDLKELKKSFIGYVAQKMGDVQTLIAHLYLSPQDVNLRGLKPASLTGDKVMVEAEESITMMGSLYGEHNVTLKAPQIRIERPEIRFKKEVDFTTKSGGIWGSSKTTQQILEYVIPGHGGDVETGKEGRIVIEGDHIGFKGAQIKAGIKGLDIHAKKSLVDQPFISVDHIAYDISETGTFGGSYSESGFVKKEEIHPSEFNSLGSVKMVSKGSALLQASKITAEKGDIFIRAKDDLMFPGVKVTQEDIPELNIDGTKIKKTIGSKEIGEIARIKAHKGKVIIESLEGKISGVRPNILSKDPQIRARAIELMEEHDFRKTLKRKQKTFVVGSTVDPGIMLVMAAAITVATGGTGVNSLGAALAKAMAISAQSSPVMFAMVSAGANALANQTILSGIVNKGDLGEVVKEITSEDSLKSLGITIATAGLGEKFNIKAPTGTAGFEKHLTHQAKKILMDNALKVALKGEKIEEALKNAGMQTIINAFASYGAQRIGDAYAMGSKDMDYLTHKLLHGALGGATGALLGDDVKKGLISGAMSAMVAEVLAEATIKPQEVGIEILDKAHKEGRILSEQEYFDAVDQELRPLMDKIKVVTGVLALASGQDVGIAMKTSENALDNNALPMMMAAAYGAYKVASVAYVFYDTYTTYQNEGVEAAVQKLVVDGAIAVAVGQGIKGGFYLVGNVAYPTAKAAWSAYVAQSPLMMKIIEGGSHQFGKIKEQVGKGYNKVKDKILDGERKDLPPLNDEAKRKMKGENILKQEDGLLQNNKLPKANISLKFEKDAAVQHFAKHGSSIRESLGKTSYNLKDYMNDANHVINTGAFVPELNAFVKLIGGTGDAKVAFVGIKKSENIVTTFHIKYLKELINKAPSLGWLK